MVMTDRNEALVREAYEAYGRGDVARMLEFVDPELEWTYLNPAFENPEPETCHGRDQLQLALERQAGQGLASRIEEIVASGDKVMVVIRTPGVDRVRVRQAEDRNYLVLTLDKERISRMRACRNREEARGFAGIT
jgi:ketosteroid isomerase-like protein